MGGLAGFIGTYLIGPRVGLFAPDEKMAYVLDDLMLEDDGVEQDMMERVKLEAMQEKERAGRIKNDRNEQ
jgi:hypothetical protein